MMNGILLLLLFKKKQKERALLIITAKGISRTIQEIKFIKNKKNEEPRAFALTILNLNEKIFQHAFNLHKISEVWWHFLWHKTDKNKKNPFFSIYLPYVLLNIHLFLFCYFFFFSFFFNYGVNVLEKSVPAMK